MLESSLRWIGSCDVACMQDVFRMQRGMIQLPAGLFGVPIRKADCFCFSQLYGIVSLHQDSILISWLCAF